MNLLLYNWKFHTTSVIDGRTIDGIMDMGFREYRERRLNITEVVLPDLRRARGVDKEITSSFLDRAKDALSAILTYPEKDNKLVSHGRTIVVSPLSPDRRGVALVNAYVATTFVAPEMEYLTLRTSRIVGSPVRTFISVSKYMAKLAEADFKVVERDRVLQSIVLSDFAL